MVAACEGGFLAGVHRVTVGLHASGWREGAIGYHMFFTVSYIHDEVNYHHLFIKRHYLLCL